MNTDINIQQYNEVKQYENYPMLKLIVIKNRIIFSRHFYDVEIILSSKNNDEVLFLFQEVFDIKINPIDGIFDTYLDITNISNMQIENAVYSILGNEEELFSFYCKSFIFYDL